VFFIKVSLVLSFEKLSMNGQKCVVYNLQMTRKILKAQAMTDNTRLPDELGAKLR